MNLIETQRAFKAYLLDRPNGLSTAVDDGFCVYHHAYRAQLVGALKDSFERTWAWLGDDRFEAAARLHIERAPPTSWTLNAYGETLPATLTGLYPDDPEIAELAAIDWALRRAFDGPDAAPVATERLTEVDWDAAVIRFVPTARLIRLGTNAAAIWTAIANDAPPPSPETLPEPVAARVWRHQLSPRFTSIDPVEAEAFAAVLEGATFSRICERLGDAIGITAAVERVGGVLAQWLADELIASIDDGPPLRSVAR